MRFFDFSVRPKNPKTEKFPVSAKILPNFSFFARPNSFAKKRLPKKFATGF